MGALGTLPGNIIADEHPVDLDKMFLLTVQDYEFCAELRGLIQFTVPWLVFPLTMDIWTVVHP